MVNQLSQGPLIRYYKTHPQQAPPQFTRRLQAAEQAARGLQAKSVTPSSAIQAPPGAGTRFNHDNFGLPQNEESITACGSNSGVVLGGTNDYRGLFDPQQNFTGWHFSTDGGATLRNEGLLPAVKVGAQAVPSGGDPVDIAGAGCALYAGSLNYDPNTLNPSAIGVYRTTPKILASCPGGNSPSCWPDRRAVVSSTNPNEFLDKDWIYAGGGGKAGTDVWAVYTDFLFTQTSFTASLKAVRCNASLSKCSSPINISGNEQDVQFGDVTIGPDGRTYISWTEVRGELTGQPQTFIPHLRVAAPGSTRFGPIRTVAVETNAIPFSGDFGILNATDFRVATYPKSDVRIVNGKPKVFMVWDACRTRVPTGGTSRPITCEKPVIKLKTSTDFGASWSGVKILSKGGSNYFPTISSDKGGSGLAVAYYTNRFDPRFDNRQDVELLTLSPQTDQVLGRQRLTPISNEPEADPLLGGFFIGDYFEVFASKDRALVHYNANYRQTRLLESGLPVAQQDNYLKRAGL